MHHVGTIPEFILKRKLRTTAKEKSRRTAERFSRACEAVALIEPPFLFVYGFKPVLPGLSGETDKPPAMRVRVEGYTKKFPKLIE